MNQRDFITKEEITENYDFDTRQTDYYSNAGKYLGLLDIGKDSFLGQIGCYLTNLGKQILNVNLFDRQKELVKLIVAHSVFKTTLKLYLDISEMPCRDEIVDIMKKSKLYKINSESTYYRRASTIIGWINWIMNQIEE